MAPIVHRVKKKYENSLREFEILDIRTDRGQAMIEKYGLEYTPTFIMLDKDDKEIDRHVGEIKEDALEKFIEKNAKIKTR